MNRLTLIVSGKVQKAGYRDKVVEIGESLGLTGFAENLLDGRVRIVAEGDEKELKLFKESVDIKNTLIKVEHFEESISEATGDFTRFSKLVNEGETDERLDTAADLLKELIVAVRSGFDKTVEKQDTTISILNKMSNDTSNIKSTLSRIETDVKDTKFSLSSFMKEKFHKQEVEIAEIRATLAKVQEAIKAA